MLFAITDIETTGGFASGNSITEIAVCMHDGERIIDEWHSLIRPDKSIPQHIVALTGITDDMVYDAPTFEEIADSLDEFVGDAVFVAHNVNFDYSFIKNHYEQIGHRWNKKKLCTVRLSKKAFPGFRSYGLGNLCRQLEVNNESAHRAQGDARATAEIFSMIAAEMGLDGLDEALKRGSGEAFLPNHINAETFHALPEEPGVYYFIDNKGKIIYIGKANNIKGRVKQHFTGKMQSARRQGFLTEMHDIHYQLTGTELMALLIEDKEIKHYWPKYNRAQKFSSGRFGVYHYEDQRGYIRLGVQKASPTNSPIRAFSSAFRARQWLFEFADQFELAYEYCGLPAAEPSEIGQVEHNERVLAAIDKQNRLLGSFLIKGKGREFDEHSLIWIDNGQLRALGFVHRSIAIDHEDHIDTHLDSFPHSSTAEAILRMHLEKVSSRSIIVLAEPELEN